MVNRRSVMGLSAGVAILGAGAVSRGWGESTANQSQNGFRWLSDFAAKGKGASDDTGTFQRAIDYVRNIALRTRDTSCLPSLLIPAGRYVLTETIDTAPWIKLCSVGGVLLDFSLLPVGWNGLTCRNETTLPATELRFPGDRSPFLDGTGGTISILGPGKVQSEGWGIVMGNRQAGFSGAVRDAGGRNVVVTGWRGALRIDPVNTYLSAWFSSRFEQNREDGIYVAPGIGRSVNSGERMTFFDCTFAGSARAIDINSDSMDFVFDACSFDFNGDVVYFGRQARFGTVAFNHCHIEGIDGLLVNATAAGKNLRTVFRDSIVLPRRWKRKDLNNAPRQLVAGTAKFSASGVEWRFESPQQGALTALIGDEVPVESVSAMSFQKVQALPWRGSVINADSLFTLDSPGTPVGALTHWSMSSAASGRATGEIVAMDTAAGNGAMARSRQALRLASPDQDNAPFSVTTRTPFPVSAGETVQAACAATSTGTTGRTAFTFQFYAAGGVPLSVSESQSTANELPSAQAAVPAGAVQAVLKTTFIGWTGKLEINELAIWRSS
ncbi:hypothetical protein [Paraburkholderia nemoris]|jgi:Endopolygalacturonase|uniref:hypothetical protein n=1 Tax=Paraburkholderia nemoris TaxID=2793076 RepID=UPI001B02A5BD|nr:hypothetical protein [Paraburkholderia nemoris]CAE6820494.1 hypothetical protein LMG22931_06305 [Paraburkholderia nemoris]